MTLSFPVHGGCQCGAVRYSIGASPTFVCVCHCVSCRRSAGAESVGWLTEPDRAFRVERGVLAIYKSSPGVERGFCATCGTSLTYRNVADSIDVTLASLDDPELFPPTDECWLEERLSWDGFDPALALHQRGSGAG